MAYWTRIGKDFLATAGEQVIGALLAIGILVFQIRYGVIHAAEVRASYWAIAWPYVFLVVALFIWHLIRTPYLLHKEAMEQEKVLQLAVQSRDRQIDRLVNANRPEVFATYSSPTVFNESPVDSWNPGLWLHSQNAISLSNHGRNIAFDLRVEPVVCKAFHIVFTKLPKLGIGETLSIGADLSPTSMTFGKGRLCMTDDANGQSIWYVGDEEASGKTATIQDGMFLKVIWRDSNGYYFFSTSRNGEWSAVQRMEAPITDAEMYEAYAEDEVVDR